MMSGAIAGWLAGWRGGVDMIVDGVADSIVSHAVPMFGEDMTEPTLEEKYKDIAQRYDSMCEAAEKNQAQIGKLAAENSALKSTVIRLGAEAAASQQNAQLLGDDFNERSRQKDIEITELRSRLREAGLEAN